MLESLKHYFYIVLSIQLVSDLISSLSVQIFYDHFFSFSSQVLHNPVFFFSNSLISDFVNSISDMSILIFSYKVFSIPYLFRFDSDLFISISIILIQFHSISYLIYCIPLHFLSNSFLAIFSLPYLI